MKAPGSAPTRLRPPGEDGIALLIVLVLSMVLIPFAVEFTHQVALEARTASNVRDQLSIDNAIEGQLQVLLARFRYDGKGNEVDSYEDAWNDEEVRVRTEAETGVNLTSRVWDEKGKLNLFKMVEGEVEEQKIWRQRFIDLLKTYRAETPFDAASQAEEIAEAVVNYMLGQGRGTIPTPARGDKRKMLVLEEMLFVHEDVGRNAMLVDRREEEDVGLGLHRYVTLYGDGRVNLNTAPLVVLKCLFPHSPEVAEAIISRREGSPEEGSTGEDDPFGPEEAGGNPFTDVNQVNELDGVDQQVLAANHVNLARDFDVVSEVYGLRISAATGDTQRHELFVIERVPSDDPKEEIRGFRYLLAQERTDPIEEEAADEAETSWR